MESKCVNVRFPKELYERIKANADELGLNVSSYIKMALVDYLKRNDKECGHTQK